MSPLVFQVTHRRPPWGIWTHVFQSVPPCGMWGVWRASPLHRKCGGARRASPRCSSRRSSWENERLDWSDPASRAVGHSRDMGPFVSMWRILSAASCSKSNRYLWLAESPATLRIGSGEAIGQWRRGTTWCKSGSEPQRQSIEAPIEKGNRGKRGLDLPGGEKAVRAAITRMLDFGQFDFGQFDFGQLAEVEIGRSRNWPKSNRLWFSCFLFFFLFLFLFFCFSFSCFFFFFSLFLFLFVFLYICLFFLFPPNPKTPNPKPQTLKT